MKRFCQHGDWITYTERLSYYFKAKSITDANRKKAVLLWVCGTETFSFFKVLITPNSLQDKTFDKLSQPLEEHCNPAPSVIVGWFNFYMCQQQPNKTISDFIIHLKKQSVLWIWSHYPLYVKELADCRCHGRLYLQAFIGGKKLNFDQARQIALVMENADKNVHDIAPCSNTAALTQQNISRIDRGNYSWGKAKNHVSNVKASTRQIIVTSGMQPATSARKLATFQQPAWKGTKVTKNCQTHKVDRDEHDNNTHSTTSRDTASVHKLFRIS